MWLVLFIIGTVVMALALLRDSLGAQLPGACPRCGAPDQDMSRGPVAVYVRWYRSMAGERLRCRHCLTAFKNHPNGTLVEDREG
ncbi:MAG: hypothetical protein JWP01_417 [Myxococcales bacterium]|nr:hypothetical protein [Myxococcales bacterium]